MEDVQQQGSTRNGNIYVVDSANGTIRMISNGQVTTIAGNKTHGYLDGDANIATFEFISQICIAPDDSIYVTEYYNRIRKISGGRVSTFVDYYYLVSEDLRNRSWFENHHGICLSQDGDIYVADFRLNYILKIITQDEIYVKAGKGEAGFLDGEAQHATFNEPNAICMSDEGTIYVADTQNRRIRVISNGVVSTLTADGTRIINSADGICVYDDGEVYTATQRKRPIRKVQISSNLPSHHYELSTLFNSESLSDITLRINNQQYHLHTFVIHSLCPRIIRHTSTIENARISDKSIRLMFEMIYSNSNHQIIKTPDNYDIKDLIRLVELTWLFEAFKIKNLSFVQTCVEQFKLEVEHFMTTEHITAMNQNRTGVFGLIHDLIIVSETESLERSSLVGLLNHLVDQFKNYLNRPRSDQAKADNHSVSMSASGMFTLFGLATEPRVIDEPEIIPEAVKEYYEIYTTVNAEPDFTILTHDRSFAMTCHKAIMYSKWSYFRGMIDSGLMESESGEMIMSEDWTETRLYDFVRYIYTHEVGFDSVEDAFWILNNLSLYGLTQKQKDMNRDQSIVKDQFELLVETCRSKVFEEITDFNCCELYRVAMRLGYEPRIKECYSYLVYNVVELMKDQQTANQLMEFGAEFIGKLMIEQSKLSVEDNQQDDTHDNLQDDTHDGLSLDDSAVDDDSA